MATNEYTSWHRNGCTTQSESNEWSDVPYDHVPFDHVPYDRNEWRDVPYDMESSSFTDFRALIARQRSLVGMDYDETTSKDGNVEGDFFTLCVGVHPYPPSPILPNPY